MKIICSGNGFGRGARHASKRLLESPKTKYWVQSKKWIARNENKAFWQWFGPGARNVLKGLLEMSKTKYSVQTKKWLARNENEPFWQWFWARGQKCFKTAFWRLQKPKIRSRSKNGLRAMKISCSGNGFEPRTRNGLKKLSGGSRNQIFGPDRKIVRAQ